MGIEVLSQQQRLAINNYMSGMNKRVSLEKAGYKKSYQTKCNEWFNQPAIAKEVKRRQTVAMKKAQLNEQWIIDRLMQIAGADLGELIEIDTNGVPYLDWSKLSPDMRAAIGGVQESVEMVGRGKSARPVRKLKVTNRDALRALEMLAKYLGMFTTKIEVSGEEATINRLLQAQKVAASSGAKTLRTPETEDEDNAA